MNPKFDRRVLPITSAVAAALIASGCSRSPDTANSDVAVCSDGQNRRVDDAHCRSGRSGGSYGWYYIGRGGAVARVGQRLSGGTDAPHFGRSYATASPATVSRGGLGLSGRSGIS